MKTIPGILIDCARNSSSGTLDVLLAERYLAADEWGRAVAAIQKALNKIHADANGKAFWILGNAHLKQGQVKLARSAFEKAAEFQEYRDRAQYWLATLSKHSSAGEDEKPFGL